MVNVQSYINNEWRDKHGDSIFLRAPQDGSLRLQEVPTMFVGIGGRGIRALAILKNRIDSIYTHKNTSHLEYMLIDADNIAYSDLFRKEDRIVIQSADTAMLLREGEKNPKIFPPGVTEWLDKNMSPFRIMNGAAGVRQAGRLILFLNAQRIYDAIKTRIGRLSIGCDQSKKRIQVFLITGIGGGTGSGMFVDVSYMIRNICETVELNGIIVMPDVTCIKPGLKNITIENIKRNGFAALKELEYLMMLERYHQSFDQTYPGHIGSIHSKANIFDYCVLVGAMRSGRNIAGSEDSIYQKISEYILTEMQEKRDGCFGIQAAKSNIVHNKDSKDFTFAHYISIGAKAKYLPRDYYYSLWLRDVFTEMMGIDKPEPPLRDSPWMKAEFEGFQTKINSVYTALRLVRSIKRQIKDKWDAESAGRKLHFETYNDLRLFLQEKDDRKKSMNYGLDALFREEYRSSRIQIFKRYRKGRYKKIFGEYKEWLFEFIADLEALRSDYVTIQKCMDILYNRCTQYNLLDMDETWLAGREEFEKIRSTIQYKESTVKASAELLKNIQENKDKWLGVANVDADIVWLSDYVAELLSDYFRESGSLSIMKNLDYMDGDQKKVERVKEIFSQLNEESTLWPMAPTNSEEYTVYEILSVPGEEGLGKLAEKWQEQSDQKPDIDKQGITGRMAKVIYSPGYALYNYEGIKEFEDCYIKAQNKDGLHLYAVDGKDWRELPSPYCESKWTADAGFIRPEEKERNRHYGEVFGKAKENKIITFNDKSHRYCIDKMGDEEGIPIGDIEKKESYSDDEYDELAKNMFIRMYIQRNIIDKELSKSD